MGLSLATRLAMAPPALRREWIEAQPVEVLQDIKRGAWWFVARPEQLAPVGDWFIHLLLAGRGFGKSRSASEWLIDRVLAHPVDANGSPTEWLAVAQTLTDARSIVIEGVSGLLNCLRRRGLVEGRDFIYRKAPRLVIDIATGQRILIDAADDPDVGRGYNLSGALLDEFAKWRYPRASWMEGIMPALRAPLIGDHPRAVIATTPKPIKILAEWVKDRSGSIHVTTGSTFDNASNLSTGVLDEMLRAYDGSSLGQQELYGKLLAEVEGALWSHAMLNSHRVNRTPDLVSVVTGIDPNASGTGDEFGIVSSGRGVDGDDYVLRDRSTRKTGHEAALLAWRAFAEVDADFMVVEKNQGQVWLIQAMKDAYGELQKEGLFLPGGSAPIKPIDARAGKRLRAQPISSRHEQGRAHLVGGFPDLEDQLCGHDFSATTDSPDRMDAMVYSELYLMGRESKPGKILPVHTEALPGASDPYSLAGAAPAGVRW